MKTLVVYDSMFGNTEQIARVIADTLRTNGEVSLIAASHVAAIPTDGVELLVIGGPTQAHGDTPPIEAILDRIPAQGLRGVAVATFDTRLRWPRLLSGSAADTIAKRLRQRGAVLIVPPESFFVTGREGPLENGEIERAAGWARGIVAQLIVEQL
jgi:flavodoxin I